MVETAKPTPKETPGVCGGYPCIDDTRISVRLIIELFRKTGDFRAHHGDVPAAQP
jgi:uncharacterized protein (DUF433 family)